MRKTIIGLLLAASLLPLGAVEAQADVGPRARITAAGSLSRAQFAKRLDRRFTMLDVGLDGGITTAEFLSGRPDGKKFALTRKERIAGRLTRMDADGDGAFTYAEMRAAREKRDAAPADPATARIGPVDLNGDGLVSRTELQIRGTLRFAQLDLDGNGVITPQEHRAIELRHRSRRQR